MRPPSSDWSPSSDARSTQTPDQPPGAPGSRSANGNKPCVSSDPFAVEGTRLGQGGPRGRLLPGRECCPEETAPPFGEAELEGC
jgi:hypothetical protein